MNDYKINDEDDYTPFPVDALPAALGEFVQSVAKSIGCDVSFVALPALSALGASMGNGFVIQAKPGWTEPPIIWTGLVGESGSSKTPATRPALRPTVDREKLADEQNAKAEQEYAKRLTVYRRSLKVWESQKNTNDDPPEPPKEPVPKRYMVRDITIEALNPILSANPSGVLLHRDELASWIGDFNRYSNGKGDEGQWLSLHGNDVLSVDRKTGEQRRILAENPFVCITGGIQPGVLRDAMKQSRRDSGMLARFLLAYPPRSRFRTTRDGIDPEAEKRYASVVNTLYDTQAVDEDGKPSPSVLTLSDDAWVLFNDEWGEKHADEAVHLSGDMSAAWAKLKGYALRLAGVIHAVRFADSDPSIAPQEVIDRKSMESAIQLVEWFKLQARRVYSELFGGKHQTSKERLDELISDITREGGTASIRDLSRGSLRGYTADLIREMLQPAVDDGRVTWTSWKGGKPTAFSLRTQVVSGV
jgi:hypothetical protein